MKQRLLAAVVAMVAALVSSCGQGVADRTEVLADVADQQIVPAYENLLDQVEALDIAARVLCQRPTEASLEGARQALVDARQQWSYTEAVWVGPVMDRRAWATIDWPIDVEEIESLIADDAVTLDQERLSRRIGSDQRGLGAVEYILSSMTAQDSFDNRRCDYLTGITEVIVAEAAFIPDDWTISFEDGDAYRTTFSGAANNGLDSVVNDSLFLLDAIADAELGVALGAMEEPADPTAILEGPFGLGLIDLEAHLAGLEDLYLGADDGAGLSPLLDAALVQRLTNQFAAARQAVAVLDGPLRSEIINNADAAADARAAIKAVQVTVATEVVAALGITIGFSDADGDSG